MNDQLGLYVHVPYCTSICPYCDFNVYVAKNPPWQVLQEALLTELTYRAAAFLPKSAASVYFGGGTPSLAPASLIQATVEAAKIHLGLLPNAEITLEMNPENMDLAHLLAFRAAGVNRLSIGWQSMQPRLLKVLGRRHSPQESLAVCRLAHNAGFTNISMDLIFAVPGQTMEDLTADLQNILLIAPEHVSLYALTYHAGTPFYQRRATGRLKPADEELEVRMMQHIETQLLKAGYEHYEVSNYAKPGFRAVHNSMYWQGGTYLGIGPGSQSFVQRDWQEGWRWENTREPTNYIAAWQATDLANHPRGMPQVQDVTTHWHEVLSARQLFTERMLCGLRHTDGVLLSHPWYRAFAKELEHGTQQALAYGWATLQDACLKPTSLGMQHADALAALFF